MSENKKVVNSILINAPVSKVWQVLVDPSETKKYMFGCEALSDWKTGSSLIWKGNYEGKEMIFVTGFILSIEPEVKLKYSVFDPNADMADIPENYLDVLYELSQEGSSTRLTVTQDGFEHAANGEKRYEETYNHGEGWNPVLVMIKSVAETGSAG